jgi:hypothetical protein
MATRSLDLICKLMNLASVIRFVVDSAFGLEPPARGIAGPRPSPLLSLEEKPLSF